MNVRDGILAGAAGTAVLNAFTYTDMAVRGRPPSELPQKVVSKIAESIGIEEIQPQRRDALAALLGYADGFAAGVFLAATRPMMRGVPWMLMGLLVGGATMIVSEGSATLLGQTDPREWSASDWISDIVPRALFGWTACIAFDLMEAQSVSSRSLPAEYGADELSSSGYVEEVEFQSQRMAPWGT